MFLWNPLNKPTVYFVPLFAWPYMENAFLHKRYLYLYCYLQNEQRNVEAFVDTTKILVRAVTGKQSFVQLYLKKKLFSDPIYTN